MRLAYSEPLSRVEAGDDERQGGEHLLQQGNQERLGDAGHRADVLELRDLVDQVDVVDALGAVAVALVDRVHAQVARPAAGIRAAALADAHRGRPGALDGRARRVRSPGCWPIRRVTWARDSPVALPRNSRTVPLPARPSVS